MKTIKTIQIKPQLGLTLIELMIAMTLGLLLLAGVLGVFISNSKSAKFTKEQASIQQDGRFALDYIRRYMQMSGLDDWFSPLDVKAAFGANVVYIAADAASTNVDLPQPSSDGTGSNQNFDRLVLEYDVTSELQGGFSCNGTAFADLMPQQANAGKLTQSWRIREEFSVVDNKFGCSSYKQARSGTKYITTKANNFAVLVDGVVAFQVLYGVNLTNDLYTNAEKVRYLNATDLQALPYKRSELDKRILSVQYALLIQADSDLDSVSRVSNMKYNVLDREVTVSGRMPNLYTSSFKFRNGG